MISCDYPLQWIVPLEGYNVLEFVFLGTTSVAYTAALFDEYLIEWEHFAMWWRSHVGYYQLQRLISRFVGLDACIDTSCDSGTFTLETYYSNIIAICSYMCKSAWSTGRVYIGSLDTMKCSSGLQTNTGYM